MIVLTASIENQEIVQALRLGARGVIHKEAPPQLLMKCIHCDFEEANTGLAVKLFPI